MNDFLSRLAALSLGGGAVILMLLAARVTGARYSARWRCWIWLLLCLRLAIPVSLIPQRPQEQAPIRLPAPSDRVLYQYTPVQPAPEASSSVPSVPPQLPVPSASIPSGSADPPASSPSSPPASAQPISLTLSQTLFFLWAAGFLGVLVWNLFCHLRFKRYLHRWSQPVTDPQTTDIFHRTCSLLCLNRRPTLLSCQGVLVPMLAGLLHPVLLLPPQLPEGDALRYALLHEVTHYIRRDILLKSFVLWVCALHWFNPLVWWMLRVVEQDTELACDEGALRRLSPEERAAYGRTVLDAADQLRQAQTATL